MAGWKPADKYRGGASYVEDFVSGLIFAHNYKPGFDLMQNCDLPPPLKVIAGPDKTLSPMNRVYNMIGEGGDDRGINMSKNSVEDEKLKLLKALRLSQTRAREAERKLDAVSKEKDVLSKLLLEESLQLFAYRQWMKLMEFQVLKLEKQLQEEEASLQKAEDHHKGSKRRPLILVVAACGVLAGFSFALGFRYMF